MKLLIKLINFVKECKVGKEVLYLETDVGSI